MTRKLVGLASVVVAALLVVAPVAAAGPAFGAGIWADGRQWGTKLTTYLPAPHGANARSFDKLYFITPLGWTPAVGPAGFLQAPVAEAAPGNPAYNGGRWAMTRVTVLNPAGVSFPIASYAELMAEAVEGDVLIDAMPSFDGGHTTPFFQCPLLPFKG